VKVPAGPKKAKLEFEVFASALVGMKLRLWPELQNSKPKRKFVVWNWGFVKIQMPALPLAKGLACCFNVAWRPKRLYLALSILTLK
jgi:hypothetical protein